MNRENRGKENARARSHTRLIVGTRRDSNNDKLGYLPRTASTTLRITSCFCSNFTSLLAPSGSPIRCISYRWCSCGASNVALASCHRNYFNLSIYAGITVTNYYSLQLLPRFSTYPFPSKYMYFRKSNSDVAGNI